MAEHPNARVIREMAESETLGPPDYVTDDVVWHVIGRDEPFRGKAAMQGGGGPARDYEIVDEKLHDVLANDDHAISLVEVTARRGGRDFTFRTAEIYHMKDGRITERWAFSDDTEAIKRFFG